MKKKILFAIPILFVGAVTVFALSSGYNSPSKVSNAIFGSVGSCGSAEMTASQVSGSCPMSAMTAAADGCCPDKAAAQTAVAAVEELGSCAEKGASIQTAAYVEGTAAEFAVAAESSCPMSGCSEEAKQVAANCDDCPKAKEDCASCPMSGKAAVQTADAGETAKVVAAQE